MKTRYIDFDNNDAKLDYSNYSSGKGFIIRSASGKIINVPKNSPDPAAFASDDPAKVPTESRLAQNALNTLLALDAAIVNANRDLRYSDQGRKENLLPMRISTIKTLIAIDYDLRKVEKTLAEHKAQLYAVPQLRPDDVVGYLRDREIRDSLRGLVDTDVMRLLSGEKPNGLSADASLILAVLRSPIKAARLEQVANQIWRSLAEERDPVLHETIKIIEGALEWSQMILGMVVGIVKRELIGYAGKELFDIVYPLGGADLFGFSSAQIAQLQRTAA